MPSESVPVGQSTQDEAPGVAEYVPVEQDLHAVIPASSAYWPGKQSTHALRPHVSVYVPGEHTSILPSMTTSHSVNILLLPGSTMKRYLPTP